MDAVKSLWAKLSGARAPSHALGQTPAGLTPPSRFGEIGNEVWEKHLIYPCLKYDVRALTTFACLNRATRQLVFGQCRDAWLYAARCAVPATPDLLYDHDAAPGLGDEVRALSVVCKRFFSARDRLRRDIHPQVCDLDDIVGAPVAKEKHSRNDADGYIVSSFSPDGRYCLVSKRYGEHALLGLQTWPLKNVWGTYVPFHPQYESWSPDSRVIAAPSISGPIWVFYGTHTPALLAKAVVRRPWTMNWTFAWSPTGASLAIAANQVIDIIDTSPLLQDKWGATAINLKVRHAEMPQVRGSCVLARAWNASGTMLTVAWENSVAVYSSEGTALWCDGHAVLRPRPHWLHDRRLLCLWTDVTPGVVQGVAKSYDFDEVAGSVPHQISHTQAIQPCHAALPNPQGDKVAMWGDTTLTILDLHTLAQQPYCVGKVSHAVWNHARVLAVAHTTEEVDAPSTSYADLIDANGSGGRANLYNSQMSHAPNVAWLAQGEILMVQSATVAGLMKFAAYAPGIRDPVYQTTCRVTPIHPVCVSPDGAALVMNTLSKHDKLMPQLLSFAAVAGDPKSRGD